MGAQKDKYSRTLNLPKTDFPMRANLSEREPQIIDRWEEMEVYRLICESSADRPTYILHDGPPYANEYIHAGTAMNKVLKDFVIKYQTMKGMRAPYLPGWDCHGQPIEHIVVSGLEERAKELSTAEIRHLCREHAQKYVDIQREQFRRLGVFGKWDEPYLTMNKDYEATVISAFKEVVKKGYVYRTLKPVYWCTSCETALAEAEVEYAELESYSIFLRFEVVEGLDELRKETGLPIYFTVWTTTPWTLPANLAVAVNPNLQYIALKASFKGEEGVYILAMEMLEDPLPKMELSVQEEVATFKGSDLEGVVARHPFYDRPSPLVLADHVSREQGTGCVHTAPGHGHEDYLTGVRYGLSILAPVDNQGCFTAEAEGFEGRYVFDADPDIVKLLDEKGRLLSSETVSHSYPHCWRCKNPIIFRATEQWFISVENLDLRKRALTAVEETEWIPRWGEARIEGMLQSRPDWCISRQRHWGVPIPVFICHDCGRAVLSEQTVGHFQELVAEHGVDVWYEREAEELLPEGFKCPECKGGVFSKGQDILDVWFESGSSHLAVLTEENHLRWPADLYLEGSDQHRGWFQLSLLVSLCVKDAAPFRKVVTHGFMLDGEGRAMSKSRGNVISPEEIEEKYGADILRLWVTMEDYREDISLSFDLLEQVAEAYRRIRNTIRFMLGNLSDFDPLKDGLSFERMEELDRYILLLFKDLKRKVLSAYERMEFHQIYHAVHNFCAVDLSAFYLNVIKDRLYIYAPDDERRRSAQSALALMLVDLLRMLAPILVFTTEEAYGHLPEELSRREFVHLEEMVQVDTFEDEELRVRWEKLMRVRQEANIVLEELRRTGEVGNSQDAHLRLYADGPMKEFLTKNLGNIKEITVVSGVLVEEGEGVSPARQVEFDDGTVRVTAEKAGGEKCARCWMWSSRVGSDRNHPQVCERCSEVLSEIGK